MTSLLTDRRLRSWLFGAVFTTRTLTRSKQWRWSWTSGETALLSTNSPSWTALWLQWSHSDSWAPQFLRTWIGTHIDSIVKKAQQRLYFLRQMRKFNLPQELLNQFYSAIIESVLRTSTTVWFSSATKSDLRRLRRVVRTAERIIGTTLPHSPRTVVKNCYCLVDATELWEPELPDTGTVSSLKQSISWTLDNNYGTHTIYTLIYYLFSLHFNCI